ncbi:MAG: hypothetical protein V1889_00345 [archaeon]
MVNEIIALIFGAFIILILAGTDAFSDIMKSFVGAFGFSFGILLGGLIYLMIVLMFLGAGGRGR